MVGKRVIEGGKVFMIIMIVVLVMVMAMVEVDRCVVVLVVNSVIAVSIMSITDRLEH